MKSKRQKASNNEERIRIYTKDGVEYLITELQFGGIEITVQGKHGTVAVFPRVSNVVQIKVLES